jgi:hypothetical protein
MKDQFTKVHHNGKTYEVRYTDGGGSVTVYTEKGEISKVSLGYSSEKQAASIFRAFLAGNDNDDAV